MAKYPIGIIYLLRDKFQMFIPGLSTILEFRFVPEIIRDLEIVNKELLYNLLDLFITSNKLPHSSLVIVIADQASIIKEFIAPLKSQQPVTQPENKPIPPQLDLEQAQKQANEFLEHIPFEEVVTKSIPMDNGIRAYATNKDFYESIKECFHHSGFEILSVLPAAVIGKELSTSLDASAINSILKNYQVLKQFNLLTPQTMKVDLQEKEELKDDIKEIVSSEEISQGKKPDKRRTILLVSVFVVLIIILVIVYMSQSAGL